MKILLLSVNSQAVFHSQIVIPFGLASLGTYVQVDGHVITGIEMNMPPEKASQRYLCADPELVETITQFEPNLVAMSTYAENIYNVLFWAETIKNALPETLIALGGNHASYIAREILERTPAVDFVICFEGEIPFKALCDDIEKNQGGYEDIPGLVYRKNGEICTNPLPPLIEDLDMLPVLNRDFFESAEYVDQTHADMITARGCPFHCTFCNCNHYWQKRYRTMSIPRVIEELRTLKQRYPKLKTVRIRDETISINRKRCLELCDVLIKEEFGLEFQAHSRLDGLDEEVIKHLATAGFTQLFIGIESGSQAVLDRLRKGINVENVYTLVPLLRKYRIDFRFSLMLATPGETLEEALQTVNLVNELDLAIHEFYFGRGIIIYPGTTDCERFLEKFPDFQWLGRQALSEEYPQGIDTAGNVMSVSHIAPEYSLDALKKLINTTLRAKFRKYDETDYKILRTTLLYATTVQNQFKTPQLFYEAIVAFLKDIDDKGEQWAIYRKGALYSELFEQAVQENRFENFAGVLSSLDLEEKPQTSLRQQFREVRTVLLVCLTRKAYKEYTIHNLLDIFDPGVNVFVIDELFTGGTGFDKDKRLSDLLDGVNIERTYPKFTMLKRLKSLYLYDLFRKSNSMLQAVLRRIRTAQPSG